MATTKPIEARPYLRVAVICDRVGATQHISFTRPLARLRAAGDIQLVVTNDRDIVGTADKARKFLLMHRPTVLVFSRYTQGRCAELLAQARAGGIPIVFHIDDDLFDVPLSLGRVKYDHYHSPGRIQALQRAIAESDLVYASTPELAAALLRHGVETPIVAGGLYCSVDLDAMMAPAPATWPVIGYMGTEGHGQDLATIMPALTRLMDEMPILRFETFGTIVMPDVMKRFGSRIGHHPPIGDYEEFLSALCRLGWWIGLAPLEDTPFNYCKADTKWVEYSFAGIAVIAADGPVYRDACAGGAGLLASDPAAWANAMRHLLRDTAGRHQQVKCARDKLAARYHHQLLEQQLVRILHRATAAGRPTSTSFSS